MRASFVSLFALGAVACGGSSAPVISAFTADRAMVGLGDRVDLSWDVTGATSIGIVASPGGVLIEGSDLAKSTVPSGAIIATTRFTLTARNGDLSTSAEVTVTVDAALLRIAEFSATPSSVDPGGRATLSWTIAGSPIGKVKLLDASGGTLLEDTSASGTKDVTPSATSVYRLEVSNIAQTVSASTTVTVRELPPEIGSFVATPNPAPTGTRGNVSWETTRADEVQISRDGAVIRPWTANGAAMGFTSFTFDMPSSVFKLEARNAFGTVFREITVTTEASVSIDAFTASLTRFTGTSTQVTFDWSTTNSTNVALEADGTPVPNFPGMASGTFTMTITRSADFVLVATNSATRATRTIHISRSANVSLSVVTGPADRLRGLDGVAVRVERTGRMPNALFWEGVTDANGLATISVDDDAFPVDVTVAKASYGAASIVGLAAGPMAPIRLDQREILPQTEVPVSGTITGKQDPMNKVIIDAHLFNTVETTMNTFGTTYLDGGGARDVPLIFVAYEIDAQDQVVNGVITAARPRDGAAVNLAIDFPMTPLVPESTLIRVNFPTSGIVRASFDGALAQVIETADAFEHAFVFIGNSRVMPLGPDVVGWNIQSYRPNHGPALGQLRVFDTMNRFVLQVQQPRLGVSEILDVQVVRALDLPADGTRLFDAALSADAPGYDALAVHIGEDFMTQAPPAWRVFFPLTQPLVGGRIPRLPTAVTLAGIGLPPNGQTSVVYLLQEMESGAPWSEPALEQVVRTVRYQIGSNYQIHGLGGF